MVAFAYLAQGVFAEFTRRTSYLKDLQIIKLLRELNDEKSEIVAQEYEDKVLIRIDRFNHGRTPVRLTLAAIVRGTPIFWFIMCTWIVIQAIALSQGSFTLDGAGISFVQCLIGGFIAEGIFSVLKPWVKPISERYGGITERFKEKENRPIGGKPKEQEREEHS